MGKYINKHYKRIQQLDLFGNIVDTFESIKEAFAKTGINASTISQVAKGTRKTAGGYK